MKAFAEDEDVIQKFYNVALSRKIMPSPVRSKGATEHVHVCILVCMCTCILNFLEQKNQIHWLNIQLSLGLWILSAMEAKLSTRLCHVLPTQKVCCSMLILYTFSCVHARHICDDSSKHFIHLTYNYTHTFEEKHIHQYRAKRFLE